MSGSEPDATGPPAPDDPLAPLVDLLGQPTPADRPSPELAAWARAQATDATAGAPATPPSPAPPSVADDDAAFAPPPAAPEPPPGAAPSHRDPPAVTAVAIVAPSPDPTVVAPVAVSAPEEPPGAGAGAPDAAERPVSSSPRDRTGRPARRSGRPGSARLGPFWRWGFPVLILVLAILVPVLALAGKGTVLTSTEGRLLNQVTNPADPGFQIITEPTPTLLLVQTDSAGVANGLTVMSLTGDESAGLIFVPMTTVLELPGIGNIPLDAAASRAGLEGLQKAVEGVLGVGMAEVAVVDPQGWADLVAPLGTLQVSNPDDVKVAGPSGEKTVLFPKGPITLAPTDVATYLETLSPGENDLNRLVRHQAFWEAWLRAVGTSDDPAVVPGESASGLGRFVRELASDRVDMAPLPVESASIPGSDLAVYLPVDEQVTSLVARLVPFPVGAPPGARPRVRLLDGTGTLDHGLGAVGNVVAAGGQVDQIGNADAFGVATTTFQYRDDARLPEVEALRAGIGVGDIVKISSELPAIDVTIILGADYAAQPPPSLAPVTSVVR